MENYACFDHYAIACCEEGYIANSFQNIKTVVHTKKPNLPNKLFCFKVSHKVLYSPSGLKYNRFYRAFDAHNIARVPRIFCVRYFF